MDLHHQPTRHRDRRGLNQFRTRAHVQNVSAQNLTKAGLSTLKRLIESCCRDTEAQGQRIPLLAVVVGWFLDQQTALIRLSNAYILYA